MLVWVCNSSPAGPANQQPKSTSWSHVLFFFFVPLDNKGEKKKKKKNHIHTQIHKHIHARTHTHPKNPKTDKQTTWITRDGGQGSTHVLGFRRTCCYGNAGCSRPVQGHTARHARSGDPGSHSSSIAASSGCSGGMHGGEPGAGAPQLCTQGPPFTRVLPPPQQGLARGPAGCLRCLVSCSPNRKSALRLGEMMAEPWPVSHLCRSLPLGVTSTLLDVLPISTASLKYLKADFTSPINGGARFTPKSKEL